MMHEEMLEKTIRINMLLDFYHVLLTEKQQVFMRHYYDDNYSLGEIAGEFDISRQAVYEHIKRAEHMLEEYETKLQLLRKHEERRALLQELCEAVSDQPEQLQERLNELITRLERIE